MNKLLFATTSLAAALAQPAAATTFPSLTTIYVGTGVYDDGGSNGAGTATAVHCSNVSSVSVQIRVVVLSASGSVAGSQTTNVAHGATVTHSTHLTSVFVDASLATGGVAQGALNIEATDSAVFCSAQVVNAALSTAPDGGESLRLVRVNPHPGTAE